MRRLLSAALLILLPMLARASCIPTSGILPLQKIRLGDPPSTWIGCVNNSLDLISVNVPYQSTASFSVMGQISVSTITGNPSSGGIYIASTTRVGAGGGLSVDFGAKVGSMTVTGGLTASSSTLTATGASQYSVQTSSGIDLRAGTLRIEGPGGLDASGTGLSASTGSFTAAGASQFSLYTSSGVDVKAGTLRAEGSGGILTTYGSSASTFTATATGNSVYGVTVASGVNVQAGTLLAQGPVQMTRTGNGNDGYSLVTSSGIDVRDGRVNVKELVFPDGSHQVTAPSSGGTVGGTGTAGRIPRWTNSTSIGDGTLTDSGTGVTLPVSSSFTAIAGSTVTFSTNTSVSGSTITVNGFVNTPGEFHVIASSYPDRGSLGLTFDVSNISPSSTTFRIIANLITSAQQHLYFKIDDDAGTNYKWSTLGVANGGSVPGGESAGTRCYTDTNGANYSPNAGEPNRCEITFVAFGKNVTTLTSDCTGYDAGTDFFRHIAMCRHSGTQLSKIRLEITGGATFTGEVVLQRLGK
jgi:hypothetical protein